MKKSLLLSSSVVLAAFLFTGCGKKQMNTMYQQIMFKL